jgi:MFS family permease
LACVIEGFGESIFNILGATYIDNNVKKSRAPILYCLTSFVRLLGPALGFSLASFSLKQFVNPKLHPKINDEDPRWIGGWWIGYIFFAIMMFILSPIIMTFPKVLPRAALRRREELEKLAVNDIKKEEDEASMRGNKEEFLKNYIIKNLKFIFRSSTDI